MWKFKNKVIVLFVTFLIVMGGFGVGSAVADDSIADNSASGNSTSNDNPVSSGSSVDSTNVGGDSVSYNSVNDNPADNKAVDEGSASTDTVNDNPTSADTVNDNPTSTDTVNDNPTSTDTVNDNPTSTDTVNDNPTSTDTVNDNPADNKAVDEGSASAGTVSTDLSEDHSVHDNSADYIVNEDLTEEELGDNAAVNETWEEKGNWTGENENTFHPVYYEESQEPHENINYVETHNVFIIKGQNVNINFTDNLVVNNINLEAKKVSGDTTVVVEDLKDKSCLTDKTPVGDIYKSFNIWVDNSAGNIEDTSVDFKVEKAWINSNKIDQSTIILNMYTKGEWVEVPVTVTGEDAKYIYYTADVSGNSSFAITGQRVADLCGKVNNSTGQVNTSSTNKPDENVLVNIIERVLAMLSGDNSSKAALEQTNPTSTAHNANNPADQNLTVHFLDVGQGDSILIEYENKSMLVDAGESDQGEIVSNYLQSQGISTLDYLIATHPHSDHIGGMNDVLNNFKVVHFVDSGYPDTSKTYENMLSTIDRKNISFETPKRGDNIDFASGIDIEVLNPDTAYYPDDPNQNSVVLKLTDKNVSFLLMGDAGLEAENDIIKAGYNVNADVLKVGHHGSTTASGTSFISAVSPDISVIEVGAGNEYGHPQTETLERLEKVSKVYRTDLDGTITITTDGSTYTVTAQKTEPREEVTSVSSGNGVYSSIDSTTTQKTEPKESIKSSSVESSVYVSDSNLKSDPSKAQITTSNSKITKISDTTDTGSASNFENSKFTSTTTSSTINTNSGSIIGNSNTHKYHNAGCRYVTEIHPEHLTYFDSRKEAEAAGYNACKVCGG